MSDSDLLGPKLAADREDAGATVVVTPASPLVRWRWRWDLNPRRAEPSHAFEACSLGRSDTPPRTRVLDALGASETEIGLAVTVEEAAQHGTALRCEDAGHDLETMVQPTVADEVPQ
jgi:hypothetical protein